MIDRGSVVLPLALAFACVRPDAAKPPPPPAVELEPVISMPRVPPPVGVDPALLQKAELAPGDPENKCNTSPVGLARCLQARAHPEVPLRWDLSFASPGDDWQEKNRRRVQVVTRLHADGPVEMTDDFHELGFFTVLATYTRIRSALMMPEVWQAGVSCSAEAGEFCECGRLRVDQCHEHPFCRLVYGYPEDVARRCIGPLTLAGCAYGDAVLLASGDMDRVVSPDGEPWFFGRMIRPEQPGWRETGQNAIYPPPPTCPAP